MGQVSVNVPRGGLAGPLRQARAQLGVRHLRLTPGPVATDGGSVRARFTATAALATGQTWTYTGELPLVQRSRRWWVNWSPAAIYPALRAGERFTLSAAWPTRAPVLAADGTALNSGQAISESGSLALLAGDAFGQGTDLVNLRRARRGRGHRRRQRRADRQRVPAQAVNAGHRETPEISRIGASEADEGIRLIRHVTT